MIKSFESVLLSTENSTRLANFYKDKVGLKCTSVMEIGEKGEKAYEFNLGKGSLLYINPHSEVHGKSPNPERLILNFEVDDIEKEVKRLKSEGIKQTQDIYHIEGYGLISTFQDVDGNYFQLVQIRPNN